MNYDPLGIIRIIYQYTVSELEIDIESEREIIIIEESDINTIEYIQTQREQNEWVQQTALEYQILLDPDIVSVEWTRNGPVVITESDLYWGNY